MEKKLIIGNQFILLSLLIAGSFIVQSCSNSLYLAGSVSSTNYSHSSIAFWDPKIGGQIGVGKEIRDSEKKFNIAGELCFSMQGAKYSNSTYSLNGSENLYYAYLPLTVKYRLKKEYDDGIIVEGGVQAGLLLSAKNKYSGTSNYFDDYYKKPDIGITYGLAYKFKNNFTAGFRIFEGFSNINADGTEVTNNHIFAIRCTFLLK